MRKHSVANHIHVIVLSPQRHSEQHSRALTPMHGHRFRSTLS